MLYGKWRPRRFDEVAGQDHVVTTLRNAVSSAQVAHAYLFTGPRGTGKTTMARLLAKALNCDAPQDGEPCNACGPCTAINRAAALDLIEMDAASNRGIEDIRNLRDRVGYSPTDLRYKVYVLDEVHMLTNEAFNALLKTLEEPPPHAIFILATTELHKVPKTIVSRCQRFDFRRVANDAIVGRLGYICGQEGFTVPEEGLRAIAVQSRGGLRDAITLLEQVVAQSSETPSLEDVHQSLGLVHDDRTATLVDAIVERDLASALHVCRELGDDGVDIGRFVQGAVETVRERLEASLANGKRDDDSIRRLFRALDALASADFRRDPGSPVPLEIACGTAILGSLAPATVVQAVPQVGGGQAPQAQPQPGPAASTNGHGPADDDGAPTDDERFLKTLINVCRANNVKLAAYMNGSCEVVDMSGNELVLGCYFDFHLQNIEREGRDIIEREASRLLGREMRLKLTSIERKQARSQRKPKGGHLIDAAKAIGARPVEEN